MSMRFVLAAFLVPGLADYAPAYAQETNRLEIGGGAALVSQYRFRGVSLSDEKPALQASIDLSHSGGAYGGLWASSLDGFGEQGGSNAELDIYAGYRTAIGSGFTLDAGLLYYAFPGSRGGDFEFFEPYASLSGAIGPATAKLGLAYAPDQAALDGDNVSVSADVSAFIPGSAWSAKAHVGLSSGGTPLTPRGTYADWMIGADYVRGPLTFGIAYVDTDLGARGAARGGAFKDIVDAALIVSLRAGF